MIKRIKRKENLQYAVFGLGRFGATMVKTLAAAGCEVLAVDNSKSKTAEVDQYATHAVVADVSDENTLRTLGVDNFDVIVVSIGENMQASIICTLNCLELGAKYIVAKANNEKHAKILSKIGAHKVIIPEADSAIKEATLLMNPAVRELVESDDGFAVAEIDLPRSWVNKTPAGLNVRADYRINILLVLNSKLGSYVPVADSVLEADDKLVIGGLTADVNNFIDKM